MAADLIADTTRNRQVVDDVVGGARPWANCLVLTQRTAHVAVLADLLRAAGHDPVVLRGGMGPGQRSR